MDLLIKKAVESEKSAAEVKAEKKSPSHDVTKEQEETPRSTAQEAPAHHGGWPLFIWYMIGPNGLKRRSDKIMEKFQSGGFSDYTDLFVDWPNEGALDPRTIKAALRASASPERRKERHECPSLASDTTPEEDTFKQDGCW